MKPSNSSDPFVERGQKQERKQISIPKVAIVVSVVLLFAGAAVGIYFGVPGSKTSVENPPDKPIPQPEPEPEPEPIPLEKFQPLFWGFPDLLLCEASSSKAICRIQNVGINGYRSYQCGTCILRSTKAGIVETREGNCTHLENSCPVGTNIASLRSKVIKKVAVTQSGQTIIQNTYADILNGTWISDPSRAVAGYVAHVGGGGQPSYLFLNTSFARHDSSGRITLIDVYYPQFQGSDIDNNTLISDVRGKFAYARSLNGSSIIPGRKDVIQCISPNSSHRVALHLSHVSSQEIVYSTFLNCRVTFSATTKLLTSFSSECSSAWFAPTDCSSIGVNLDSLWFVNVEAQDFSI